MTNTFAPLALLVFAVLVVVGVLTGVYVFQFATDCAATGGVFSLDDTTANCRY